MFGVVIESLQVLGLVNGPAVSIWTLRELVDEVWATFIFVFAIFCPFFLFGDMHSYLKLKTISHKNS